MKKPAKPRNPIAVAMFARFGKTQTTHRHRADRRPKDARRQKEHLDGGQ